MDFDQDYYLNGPKTGKSNYTNYRWMPELTLAYANRLHHLLSINEGDTFLDFGCARGYLVKAMRMHSIDAYGCDISAWAIENCDQMVADFVTTKQPSSFGKTFDWAHAKDVFEHIPEASLKLTLAKLTEVATKGILIIVPLVNSETGQYIYPADNCDPSHLIRWTMEGWMKFFTESLTSEWLVNGSFFISGLKSASISHPYSTGFFTLTKQ